MNWRICWAICDYEKLVEVRVLWVKEFANAWNLPKARWNMWSIPFGTWAIFQIAHFLTMNFMFCGLLLFSIRFSLLDPFHLYVTYIVQWPVWSKSRKWAKHAIRIDLENWRRMVSWRLTHVQFSHMELKGRTVKRLTDCYRAVCYFEISPLWAVTKIKENAEGFFQLKTFFKE